MIDLLLAASSLSLAASAAEPAPPKPAMFVVRDADTTIYIFGTFHTLDGQSDWFNGNLRDAFEDSQELVLETLLPEHAGTPAAAPLPAKTAQSFGYSLAPSASFLATTRLAVSAGRSQGMSVANGADTVLRHVAEAEGKDVEGLETFASQLRMFDRMSSATVRPAAAPAQSAKPAPDMAHMMAGMESAWERGDQSVFARLLDRMSRSSPDTYRMMFAERNARWADWIAARLRSPGTVFVAVGAGHLAGKDSVLVRLAERGIESTRSN